MIDGSSLSKQHQPAPLAGCISICRPGRMTAHKAAPLRQPDRPRMPLERKKALQRSEHRFSVICPQTTLLSTPRMWECGTKMSQPLLRTMPQHA